MSKVQENNRSFFFTKSVEKNVIEVSYCLGWIKIDENCGHTGPFGIAGKERHLVMSMTADDARNLIAAIRAALPSEETIK